MPALCTPSRNFRKNLLTLAVLATLAPQSSWALDLLQAPPGTVQAYVAPNVILSLDDSTSMNTKDMIKVNNKWTKTRTEVLKDALKEVFSDKDLVPNDKMRLAWQTLGNCTSVNNKKWAPPLGEAASKGTSSNYPNAMRVLNDTHRANFLKYAENFNPCTSTPTHFMVKRADEYMRAPLHINGPWATKPGGTSAENKEFLGCRRNYHILLTDGDWNGEYDGTENINTTPINFDNQDSENNINGAPANSKSDLRPVKTYTAFTLPDGTTYKRTDPQTWIYRDIDFPTWSSWHPGYDGQYISTLSDWSFKSWAVPLQSTSSLKGTIEPLPEYNNAPNEETFTNRVSKRTATLKKYWNPRYNPATWPHMVTFTIGFSTASLPSKQFRPVGNDSQWVSNIGKYWNPNLSKPLWNEDGPFQDTQNGNNGLLIAPTSKLPYGYDGSFADYASGRAQWHAVKGGEAVEDMWHAAINGRGSFYAVEKGEDLKVAFREIIKTISTQVEPQKTTTATSGSNTSRNAVGRFIGNYDPKNAWKGALRAELIKKDGTYEPIPGWGDKDTSAVMDGPSFDLNKRLVLSWSTQWLGAKYKGGVPFKWDNGETNLSKGQKYWLGLNAGSGITAATNGENQINFIRGDRSLEGPGSDATKPMRQRKSRQGDIVNSAAWYTGIPSSGYSMAGYRSFVKNNKSRTPMIYVGGNDGMLHGFSAVDGTEKIAYVPRGVIPSLTRLSSQNYNSEHRYFVDGSPMTGDVDMSTGIQDPENPNDPNYTPDWRTLLVGTLGAGGKGYFILDVTNPDGNGSGTAFAEDKASQLVILDRTRSTEGTLSAPLCNALVDSNKTIQDAAQEECRALSQTIPDCNRAGISSGEQAACSTETAEDNDIGNITMAPVLDETNGMRTTQITRMNNNRWAVVMGNGYNSKNQRPVLLIQYLDGNKELLRIPTVGTASTIPTPGSGLSEDNGLAHPRLIDLNGDELPEIAYAGDNRGNLWKFDLTNIDDTKWHVAFGGQPLFTAKGGTKGSPDSRTLVQPITVAPTARVNDRQKKVGSGTNEVMVSVGGMMVSFGTGRNLTKLDETNQNVQTIYSVLDNTRYMEEKTPLGKRLKVAPSGGTCTPIPAADCVPTPTPLGEGVAAAKLAKREVTELNDGKAGTTTAAETLDWSVHNGWYQDLPGTGERLLKPLEYYDNTNILTIWSQIPAKGSQTNVTEETCENSTVDKERQFLNFINIMDGTVPSVPLMDLNGDGAFDDNDLKANRREVTAGAHNILSKSGSENEDIDAEGKRTKLAKLPEKSLRPTWRQLK